MALKAVLFSASDEPQLGFPAVFGAGVVLLTMLWFWARDESPYPGFPIVNKLKGEWLNTKSKDRMLHHAKEILRDAYKKYDGKPFQVIGDTGWTIMLSPHLAQEIRNDERLSFMHAVERTFLPWLPGLEPFGSGLSEHEVFQTSIRVNLTQSLGSITQVLSDETTYVLDLLLPDVKEEWTSVQWVPISTKIAARLSSKVFLGEPLCRNGDWLDMSMMYTIEAFQAARSLRQWPPFLRPIVHYFGADRKKLLKRLNDGRRIIEPEVAKRKAERSAALMAGKKPHKASDAIEWMDEQRKDEPYDITLAQFALSFAAIHTTSSMITSLLWELAANPEYIDDLRKEITDVLREDGGWKKTSLYKMKLLDSCMKEAQRLHVIGSMLMGRKVMSPVTLSDGTHLPVGSHIALPTWTMTDPLFYGADAARFDGRRFLDLRRGEPGAENRWQFVSTSPEHLGFGHGSHACPGRFFASNEIKIAAAHLLVKYDWKWVGEPPLASLLESEWLPDPEARIWLRRREGEVAL